MSVAMYPTELQRVAVYLRKSRADLEAEGRGEGETLSRHRRALTALAEQYRHRITGVYEEIVSGERILDRPAMQDLLHAVQNGNYEAVLVMDIDRLGRGNMVDQGIIQDTFKSSGTLIITPRKVYDLQDEFDEEWSEFEAFLARRELKIITRRIQRGRRQSAGDGKSVSRKPAYGYTRDDGLRLRPDAETAPVVRMIFSLAADGHGASRISAQLSEMGILTPTGKTRWNRSTIYSILQNPVYRGHIRWGFFRYKKTGPRGGYSRVRTREDEQTLCLNAHEPLVDEDTYRRCLSHSVRQPRVARQRSLVNPLAGLIVCSACGRVMQRRPTRDRPHNSLLCLTPGCRTRSARFEIVEERLLAALLPLLRELRIPAHVSAAGGEHSMPGEHGEHSKPGEHGERGERGEHAVLARLGVPARKIDAGGRRSAHTVSADAQETVLRRLISDLEQHCTELHGQHSALHDLLERGVYDAPTFAERRRGVSDRLRDAELDLAALRSKLMDIAASAEALPATPATDEDLRVTAIYEVAPTPALQNRLLRQLIETIVYTRPKEWREPDHFTLEVYLRV